MSFPFCRKLWFILQWKMNLGQDSLEDKNEFSLIKGILQRVTIIPCKNGSFKFPDHLELIFLPLISLFLCPIISYFILCTALWLPCSLMCLFTCLPLLGYKLYMNLGPIPINIPNTKSSTWPRESTDEYLLTGQRNQIIIFLSMNFTKILTKNSRG